MEQIIDIQSLARSIEEKFPEVAFAYLFGSAQNGVVRENSDIDVAVYYKGNEVFIRFEIEKEVERIVDGKVPVDVVELQKADSILAFEALSGRQLFVRKGEEETYRNFYTLTCRLYEDEIYRRKKHLKYRGYEVQWES